MDDSKENYKFDMGVRGLIVSQKILARSWKIHLSPKGIINALTNIRIFNNYLPKPEAFIKSLITLQVSLSQVSWEMT